MEFRKYLFISLTELICFAILITLSSSVQASEAVFDEIEKFVPPMEEMQIDNPLQQDTSVQDSTEIEEQPVTEDEPPVEEEAIQNSTTDEEQVIPDKKPIAEPKEQETPVETPQTLEENNPIETTVSEETPEEEKNPKKQCLTLSKLFNKYFNKCINFFSNLSFDKIIVFKETIIRHINPNKYACEVCCRPITEHKKYATPKDVIPYYFLNPLIKKHFEKIAFTNSLTNPTELLQYNYVINNNEVKKIEAPKGVVTPQGTTDIRILINAPSPELEVAGKSFYAKLVVDIRNNTLYKYDEDGFPLKAYLIATGARGTRTMPGLRIVTYKEKFPYKGAPKDCKRIFDPYSYGPYIIFMNRVNPKTGKQSYVDQFLHGNGNERSIGRKVSHGCMRTNNNVMRNELSKEVNRGDYVLIINPDIN